MFELISIYGLTFLLHAALGCGLVVASTWLAWRGARAVDWHRRGARGPAWVASLLRVGALLTLVIVAPLTGMQTGTIAAMDHALARTSQDLAIAAVLEVGKPLGIRSADQKLSLADAEQLVVKWAPQWAARGRAALTGNGWTQRAGEYWQSLPDVMRAWIASQGPRTETTPRALVHYAWRSAAAPTIAAAKWQALAFAYGLAALLIGFVVISEWCWLAYTRTTPPEITPAIS